jgi:hypothetical protein
MSPPSSAKQETNVKRAATKVCFQRRLIFSGLHGVISLNIELFVPRLDHYSFCPNRLKFISHKPSNHRARYTIVSIVTASLKPKM